VQIIGLGSAGTNIVETFLNSKKTIELLQSDITRVSLLAIDIADPEIRALMETGEKTMRAMVKAGIPKERLRLVAQSIKFPTAETMFDFINQKYNEYLVNEGAKIEDFRPWLTSTMAIPPMAGGAGRRRALAKAIYTLNYYQLGIVKGAINTFKEQALSSIITPTVILVYGLGGGTGSGIFFDFARHLRKVLGSSVPIIAFVIAPCGGDDPPAKGCSSFTAMNELSLLLNKDYNEYVTKNFGDCYRNPLNAMIWLPLLPAYSKIGNIVVARREMDEMVIDMLYTLMDFDLADLMGGIGTEVGLTNNFVHTLGSIKVMYPVEEYIFALKLYYERLEMLHALRGEKLVIMDAISDIMVQTNIDLQELYKKYLIRTGTFVEEEFADKVQNVIYSNPKLDEDYALHVRAIEDQVDAWLTELMKFLSTIRLTARTGPIEEAIVNLTLKKEGSRKIDNLEVLLKTLSKNFLDFPQKKEEIFERLKHLLPSSQIFTLRQKKLIEDYMNMASLTEKSLTALKFYDESRYLAEAVIGFYELLPESEAELIDLRNIRAELSTLYLMMQLMLRTPTDEIKMVDEHLTYVNEVKGIFLQKIADAENELMVVQESKKRKEFEKRKAQRDLKKTFGSKRYAREQFISIERDLKRFEQEEALMLDSLGQIDNVVQLYETLAKKIDPVAEYRKTLAKIADITHEYNIKISEIIEPKMYYEKSTELTEAEQMKIIFKILMEQEDTLTKKAILKQVLDMSHFRDYMKSIIRVFKTPSVMGFKPTYKTDYLWVTVTTPEDLWSEELSQEIYTSLASYVTSEVSRTITVRVIDSRDEWTTRIMVVAGRGRPEDMEAFDEMQLLYNKSNAFERHLSRSYLIEHGVAAVPLINDINHNNANHHVTGSKITSSTATEKI
jgi:hypothetical protein